MTDRIEMPMHGPVLEAMGFKVSFDYSGVGGTFEERLGRCYELAMKALYGIHPIPDSLPEPLALVHGIWSSPQTRDKPIEHAWVILTDQSVWEPITRSIYDSDMFYAYTEAQSDHIYNTVKAKRLMLRHQHFGPWL